RRFNPETVVAGSPQPPVFLPCFPRAAPCADAALVLLSFEVSEAKTVDPLHLLIIEDDQDLLTLLTLSAAARHYRTRAVPTLAVEASAARLLNPETSEYDLRVISAPDPVRAWAEATPSTSRPSDQVLATRAAVRIDDVHAGLDPAQAAGLPVRSALSVPMIAGEDLIGVLSVGSPQPGRFTVEDERLLGIIANQVAVGLQNARLHAFVRAGK